MIRPLALAVATACAAPAVAQDADAAFAALAEAATRGTPGTDVTTTEVSRGEGCLVIYAASQEVGPTRVSASYAFDPREQDLDDPTLSDELLMAPDIEIRSITFAGATPDTPGVDRTVTAPADTEDQRAFFEQNIPGSCDESGCSYLIRNDDVIMIALDDDREAQTGAIISALKQFAAACGG